MPADFGDTLFEGAIAPSVEKQAPVEDKSGLYLAEAANSGLQGVGTIFGGIAKGAIQDQAAGVLSRYRQDAMLIADAMDQGGLTPQAGRMRLRQLYSETIGNNPGLAEDIDKANSSLLSENGLGHVILEGNEEVQRNQKLADSAHAAGWGSDTDGYTNYLNATRTLETQQREITLRSAELGYTSAVDKKTLERGVNEWAKAGMPWVDQQVASAAALIDGGADPAETLLKLKADIGQVVGDLSLSSEGMDLSHITGPIDKRLAIFEDMVKGTTTTEMMNTQLATIAAQQKYALLTDNPELTKLTALSELLGQGASVFVQQRLNGRSVEIMAGLTKPYDPSSDSNGKPTDIVGSDGETVAALDTLKELLSKAADNPTPAITTEVNNVIVNTLRSLKAYNGESVKDYRAAVDFFADPSVAKWIDNGQLVVPANLTTQAKDVIEKQYDNVLLPLVEEQWTTANYAVQNFSGSGDRMIEGESSKFIEPYWNGMEVSFRPAPGFENEPLILEQVKTLNEGDSSIAGPLNTLIRAKAHMNGGTDYAKEWEGLQERLFPEPVEGEGGAATEAGALGYAPEAAPVQSDALSAITGATFNPMDVVPSDITMADFNEDIEATYATIEQTKAVDPTAMANASSPIEAARAYLGMTENNADQNRTLAAFIKNSTGTEINPAKTAWCAAFVDAILSSTGAKGTGRLNARSYLDWGKTVKEPQVGDVVVLSRGDVNGWQGHVGFYMGTAPNGKIRILGGNQGDSVSEDTFDASRVLGYRRAV